MQKKKIINFRPIFFAFVSLVFALLLSRRFLLGQTPYILLFILTFGAIITFSIIRKNLVPAIIAMCFACLGFGSYFISTNAFNKAIVYEKPMQITAQVIGLKNYAYSQRVILGKVAIEKNESYNICAYILGGDLHLGEEITFTAKLEKTSLFNLGKFSSFFYNNKIFYTVEIENHNISNITQKTLSLRDKIKNMTLERFLNTMPQDSAYVVYGAMFGDTDQIDRDIYDSFAKSGIIHILSVSGMHMAFVVAILNFFLSKTKLNKKLRFSLFAVSLFFYSYLCSFNVTVVRSSLMSIVVIFGTSFGKRYDMLTGIGLSGIILLLFSPLSVFDIGFQLSYLSVFMIAAFTKPLVALFKKAHIPTFVATPLAISIGVQAGLLPLMIKYFGQFPAASIISNLVIVPIFELAFIFAFVVNIIAIVLPFLSFLLIPATFLINPVISLSNYFASIDWLMFYGKADSSIAIICFLIVIFILSGYVMLKAKRKIILINIILIMSLTLVGIENMPPKYDNLTIFQANYANSHSTIFYTQNEYLLISDLKNLNYIYNYAHAAKIKTFDIVLLAENFSSNNLKIFNELYPNSIYLQNGQTFNGNVFDIAYITIYNNIKLPVIAAFGYNNLVLTQSLSQSQHEQLSYATYLEDINIYISWLNQTPAADFYDYLVFSNSLQGPNLQTKPLNNWFFELKHATIKFIRSLD